MAFVISALIFLQSEQAKKAATPFYADIITPEQLRDITAPEKPKYPAPVQPQRKKYPATSPLKKIPAPSAPAIKTPETAKNIPVPQAKTLIPRDTESAARFSFPEDRQLPSGRTEKGILEGAAPGSQKTPTTKERLFDKDIIGRFSEQANSSKKNDSITFDTKEYRYFGYMRRLKEKIEGIWNYPAEAIERRIYGDLYLRFTIKKDGRLGAVELLRTSGHKSLDDAALKALKDAEPFWPLPNEWNQEGFTIEGHFIYSLQGIYIK